MSHQQKEYTAYLDCLRLISSIAVVMIHVSCTRIYDETITARAWLCCNMFDSVSRFCVPVFFMISGALFLNPDRKIQARDLLYKMLRLLIAYVFWMTAYYLHTAMKWGSFEEFLTTLLTPFANDKTHLWFIPALITCYAMVPALRMLCRDKNVLKYCIFIAAVFLFAGNTAKTIFPESDVVKLLLRFNPGLMPYSMVFMLMGYWFHISHFRRSTLAAACVLGTVSTVLMIAATQQLHAQAGVADRVFVFFEYDQLPVMLQSAAVFLLGKAVFEKITFSPAGQKTLRRLGKYSFGAYLIHIFFWEWVALPMVNRLPYSLAAVLPAAAVSVFAISMLCSAVLNHIPVVRKYLC